MLRMNSSAEVLPVVTRLSPIRDGAATYIRLIPSVKKRYDYGAMISILTFNLVTISGVRAEMVIELASDHITTIIMGFAVCVSISLLIFPAWASDELHSSTTSRFDKLASSIEGCLEEFFNRIDNQSETSFKTCRSVIHSKSKDESLDHQQVKYSDLEDLFCETEDMSSELDPPRDQHPISNQDRTNRIQILYNSCICNSRCRA